MSNAKRLPRGLASRRSAVALMASGGLVAGVGLAGLGPVGASASSHREAPLIAGLPQYDTTDVYAFATDARYNIKVDNDGDAKPDITYRWKFKDHYVSKNTFLYATGKVDSLRDENLNFYQTYRLTELKNGNKTVLVKSRRVAPSDVGEASIPNYSKLRDQATTDIGSGDNRLQSFAGQAEDPFFLDLRVFDLLYGGEGEPDGTFIEDGDDTLAGFNVNSVALQVPRARLAKGGNLDKNPIVGVWSTTDRKGANGKFSQVSRLGMPLVNEVVIPIKDKNRWNASKPENDGQFLDYVTKPELPKLIEAIYGIEAPEEPRDDLVAVFLTGVDGLNQPKNVTPSEQLRLNMTTDVTSDPDRLGVIGGDTQGYPNGRRLADDVIDISLQVVEGELRGNENDLGDDVDSNDAEFSDSFPYLALPKRGSDPDPHPSDEVNATMQSAPTDTEKVAPVAALAIGLLALASGVARLGQLRTNRRRVSS